MGSEGRQRESLLILEDSNPEREALARGLRSFYREVFTAATLAEALAISSAVELTDAVLDLALPDGSSIDLIPLITGYQPNISIIVVTGFGSYAAAVEAIKLGAKDFLAKPVSFEQIIAALEAKSAPAVRSGGRPSRPTPLTLARVEWEHINRVLAESNWNISEAARRLGLQRQSLQRKLKKLAPRPSTVDGESEGGGSRPVSV